MVPPMLGNGQITIKMGLEYKKYLMALLTKEIIEMDLSKVKAFSLGLTIHIMKENQLKTICQDMENL